MKALAPRPGGLVLIVLGCLLALRRRNETPVAAMKRRVFITGRNGWREARASLPESGFCRLRFGRMLYLEARR
jgi:MYXO-CTERM domain-containing protein